MQCNYGLARAGRAGNTRGAAIVTLYPFPLGWAHENRPLFPGTGKATFEYLYQLGSAGIGVGLQLAPFGPCIGLVSAWETWGGTHFWDLHSGVRTFRPLRTSGLPKAWPFSSGQKRSICSITPISNSP